MEKKPTGSEPQQFHKWAPDSPADVHSLIEKVGTRSTDITMAEVYLTVPIVQDVFQNAGAKYTKDVSKKDALVGPDTNTMEARYLLTCIQSKSIGSLKRGGLEAIFQQERKSGQTYSLSKGGPCVLGLAMDGMMDRRFFEDQSSDGLASWNSLSQLVESRLQETRSGIKFQPLK